MILLQPIFGNIYANQLTGVYSANPSGFGLAYFIQNSVTALFLVAGLATFAYLLIGGLRYLTSGGDVKAMEESMKIITNAILGLIIIVGAYGIARILAGVTGIDIFHPAFQGP